MQYQGEVTMIPQSMWVLHNIVADSHTKIWLPNFPISINSGKIRLQLINNTTFGRWCRRHEQRRRLEKNAIFHSKLLTAYTRVRSRFINNYWQVAHYWLHPHVFFWQGDDFGLFILYHVSMYTLFETWNKDKNVQIFIQFLQCVLQSSKCECLYWNLGI